MVLALVGDVSEQSGEGFHVPSTAPYGHSTDVPSLVSAAIAKNLYTLICVIDPMTVEGTPVPMGTK